MLLFVQGINIGFKDIKSLIASVIVGNGDCFLIKISQHQDKCYNSEWRFEILLFSPGRPESCLNSSKMMFLSFIITDQSRDKINVRE